MSHAAGAPSPRRTGQPPAWRSLRAVTGGPAFVSADHEYRGRPLADIVGEMFQRHTARARSDAANRHLSAAELATAVAVTVLGPDRFDPRPDVWGSVAAQVVPEVEAGAAAWEAVLLYGCGRRGGGGGASPSGRSSGPGNWSFSVQQLRELIREGVTFGVERIEGWGKLRFKDKEERDGRIDDVVELLTLWLVVGDCPCPTTVTARHAPTRAARCAREHRIDGWAVGAEAPLGRFVMQAVVGTVNLSQALAPWFARGTLFVALEELDIDPVAFWACNEERCRDKGRYNYWTKECRGPCRRPLDVTAHRAHIVDDQLVNVAFGIKVGFFRCRCLNAFRMLAEGELCTQCPLCEIELVPRASGRWPRPKLAWL